MLFILKFINPKMSNAIFQIKNIRFINVIVKMSVHYYRRKLITIHREDYFMCNFRIQIN